MTKISRVIGNFRRAKRVLLENVSYCCYFTTVVMVSLWNKLNKRCFLPTTKIGDRSGRQQQIPQQQQHPEWLFEYNQRINRENLELYPPPIRGNRLFCPKPKTGTRSHL